MAPAALRKRAEKVLESALFEAAGEVECGISFAQTPSPHVSTDSRDTVARVASPELATPMSRRAAPVNARKTIVHAPFSDTQLGHYAITALIEEAQLTPKPALVDQRGSGAHRDLDLATMLRSAHALEPTFAALARTARRRGEPSALLRTELAQIGRAGEQDMMNATGGSNAHRGAIWIIGLLVAGASMQRSTTAPLHASHICTSAAQIACFPDRFAAPSADSHGERARQRYQVGGARQEAQDGFPRVIDVGLPFLHAARTRGIDENAARVDTLLAIMASLDDTCLLHRAGLPGLQAGQQGAQRVLQAGGSSTPAGRIALAALEHELLTLNASPGGAADLLAATLFLDMLARLDAGRSPDSWNI